MGKILIGRHIKNTPGVRKAKKEKQTIIMITDRIQKVKRREGEIFVKNLAKEISQNSRQNPCNFCAKGIKSIPETVCILPVQEMIDRF
ncbi:MAG: hypothetical protein LIO51_06295 [Clostridiales bacterium]|nr:hypothetical protein [Clostridiales bacterium]